MNKGAAYIQGLIAEKNNIVICLFFISLFVTRFPEGVSYYLYTTVFSILLWIVILTDRKYRSELSFVLIRKNNRVVYAGILLFMILAAISLLYSSNAVYGRYKFFGLLFDTIPAIFAFYLIVQELSPRQLNFIINLSLLAGLSLTCILYYKSNLSYLSSEKIFLRWAHTDFGKALGYASLCAIFNSAKRRTYISFFIALFIFSGLILSGLRAPILFVTILIVILGFYVVSDSSIMISKKITLVLFSLIFFSATFLYIQYYKPELERRFNNSFVFDVNTTKDPSIKGRIIALHEAAEMTKEKPWSGWGLGGFNIVYENLNRQKYLPYPHNILVEIIVEFGIPFFICFFVCLLGLIHYMFKLHFLLGIFFSLALWNGLFTADISRQKVLFICIAFLLLDKTQKENIVQLFTIRK